MYLPSEENCLRIETQKTIDSLHSREENQINWKTIFIGNTFNWFFHSSFTAVEMRQRH